MSSFIIFFLDIDSAAADNFLCFLALDAEVVSFDRVLTHQANLTVIDAKEFQQVSLARSERPKAFLVHTAIHWVTIVQVNRVVVALKVFNACAHRSELTFVHNLVEIDSSYVVAGRVFNPAYS